MKFDLLLNTSHDPWATCWQKLAKHAPKDLCSLKVCTPWMSAGWTMGSPEVFRFCSQLSVFAMLTELDLYHAELQDWSAFNSLPKGLVKLSFSTLSSKSGPQSLRCFDKLNMLQELHLTFSLADNRDELVVTHDLSLPNLQCFDVRFDGDFSPFELTEGDFKIVFTDLSLTGVPASCDSVFVVTCWAESPVEPLHVQDLFVLSNVDPFRLWFDIWLDILID